MDEDLDELLDEVERRFCKNVSVSAASGHSKEALKRGKDNAGEGRDGSVMLMQLKLKATHKKPSSCEK